MTNLAVEPGCVVLSMTQGGTSKYNDSLIWVRWNDLFLWRWPWLGQISSLLTDATLNSIAVLKRGNATISYETENMGDLITTITGANMPIVPLKEKTKQFCHLKDVLSTFDSSELTNDVDLSL